MIQIEHLGISPIPQLLRRYMASGKDVKFLSGISEEKMMNALAEYISLQGSMDGKNIDRAYDAISANELESIFQIIERNQSMQEGKSGLEDCMQDSRVRISTEQEVTKGVKNAVLGEEEKGLEEAKQPE